MKDFRVRLSVCALMAGLSGCRAFAPNMPAVLASAVPIAYSSADFAKDVNSYRASVNADPTAARRLRDQIVYRVMAQIDMAYGKFEGQLTTRRAGAQTAGDAAQLGLTAAATVVGASGVKDILDATSGALQGTRLSYDKNFFEQKTTESLVSQMRATRKNLQAALLTNLVKRDVVSYPLEAAWGDLIQYYYAGTIPSALVDIASAAGTSASAAEVHLKQAVSAIAGEAKQAVTVRSEFELLRKQVADPATAAQAKASLSEILTSAGVKFNPSASADELLADLRKAMAESESDAALLQKLNDAAAGGKTQ